LIDENNDGRIRGVSISDAAATHDACSGDLKKVRADGVEFYLDRLAQLGVRGKERLDGNAAFRGHQRRANAVRDLLHAGKSAQVVAHSRTQWLVGVLRKSYKHLLARQADGPRARVEETAHERAG